MPDPKRIALPTGVTLAYVDAGERAAPALILLHGMTDSWRSFERVLTYLPRSLRSVAPSQRGHGDSDKPAGAYRIADFTADIAALIERLDLGPAIVVGHSSHGLVAQRLAVEHPRLIGGIVIESGFATLRGNRNLRDLVDTQIAALRDPIDRDFVRRFQAGTFLKPVPQAFVDAMVDETLKVPAHVWHQAFAGLLEEDNSAQLGAIATPTLLVWGDRDTIVGRDRKDVLLAGIRDADILVYEGVGHTPHWEEPERFAADLARFVARVAGETRRR